MALGTGKLVEHHESGAALGVPQQPDRRLQGLIARRQIADLCVALGELALHGAPRLQHEPVGQIHATGGRGDEDEPPDEPGAERAHGRSFDGTTGGVDYFNI
jgi:hypothetical protein